MTSESDERLIIALDFGTTYSGIAYCFPKRRDDSPQVIMKWPGGKGASEPKVPTLLRYDKSDASKFDWGASLGQHNDNIVGVKLLLDPKQRRPHYLPAEKISRNVKSLPKPPIEVAADFIRAIHAHALAEISRTVPQAYMDMCRKDYILSVPAVWSDAAKQATLEAAKIAGFFPVKLIKEPEAAGLYTAKSLDLSLHPNDIFIVCDAGGGTVDLIAYEIEATSPRLEAKELVPGTGGMAGSLGLNVIFANEVEKLIGDTQWNDLKDSKAFLHAEKEFDRDIKTAYQGNEDEEYFVNFPMASLCDDHDNNLMSNCWKMTGKDLENIFYPIVTNVLQLIDQQVQAVRKKRPARDITGIFLVGGFGSSQHLRQQIEQRYPGIQVLQPNDSWAAIAKGAALSMLPNEAIVTSTSATRHYGVEYSTQFRRNLDAGQRTFRDRKGKRKANRMQWFIKIGDDLSRDHKIKFPFQLPIDYEYKAGDLIFYIRLYECGDGVAPIHRSEGERIDINCTVRSDLRGIPQSHFRKEIGEWHLCVDVQARGHAKHLRILRQTDKHGLPFWTVGFDLVISLQTAMMKFSLEINGEVLGSVDAKYD